MERCIPDRTVYELMPAAAGVKPEGADYINEPYTVCHVIYSGIQETGDPTECLVGASDRDEAETIPRFVAGADQAATHQGSFFNYDEDFARKYIKAWRWEIVSACEKDRKLG
jgi:hypothetical protein